MPVLGLVIARHRGVLVGERVLQSGRNGHGLEARRGLSDQEALASTHEALARHLEPASRAAHTRHALRGAEAGASTHIAGNGGVLVGLGADAGQEMEGDAVVGIARLEGDPRELLPASRDLLEIGGWLGRRFGRSLFRGRLFGRGRYPHHALVGLPRVTTRIRPSAGIAAGQQARAEAAQSDEERTRSTEHPTRRLA